MRSKRKRQITPHGEAARSLQHTRDLLRLLEANNGPDEKESFVRRFNDFLRTAHTVIEFLPKENGRATGLRVWFDRELERLRSTDLRVAHFLHLRTVSEHDCIVEPGRSHFAVEFTAAVTLRGSMEAELKDSSGVVLARVSQAAPPGVEGSVAQSQVSVKYFLKDWPKEDIVAFCRALVVSLDGLVTSAYRAHP